MVNQEDSDDMEGLIRLILIVEGDTEKVFVDRLLSPYLRSKGFVGSVIAIKPKKTGGGLSKYSDVDKQLKSVICEPETIVSTIFDFYQLPESFPGYDNNDADHYNQVLKIEQAMLEHMQTSLARRCSNFIPHIQLHEFESLIFSDAKGLDAVFDENNEAYKKVRDFILNTNNPEAINNGKKTAPSKRLLGIAGYNKIIHGIKALEVIGIEKMRSKCPHFRDWIDTLVKALAPELPKLDWQQYWKRL